MKSHLPIRLKFTLSESEFVTGHRAYLRKSLLNFRNFAFFLIAMTLVFAQAQVLDEGAGPLRILGLIWSGIVFLMGYVYWILPPKLYQTRPKFSGPLQLVIDENAITLEGAVGEVIAWDQISAVMERDRLFLVARKGHLPVLIPARAFEIEGALEEFRSRISSIRV